jgi:hypothetical protein
MKEGKGRGREEERKEGREISHRPKFQHSTLA